MKLEGTIAIVTGGTRGLGRAIAREYAAEGATVVCAARDLSGPMPTFEDEPPGKLVLERVDVADPDSVRVLVEHTVATYGRLDVFVANAGVNRDGRIDRLPTALWNEMIRTNLDGAFHSIQAAVPPMRAQQSGRIITVSSSMASRVAIGAAGYSATKAAIETLTRVAAIELGRHGILVNCLAPGILDDGMGQALVSNDKVWSAYRNRFSLGRAGTVTEAARAAVFLASADSSYVNGHILEVNGGLLWA